MKRVTLLAVVVLGLSALPLFARQWSSRNGGFSAEAELVDVKDGNAVLKRPDGSQLIVPLSKLSLGDLRYVKEQLKAAEAGLADGGKEPSTAEKPQDQAPSKADASVDASKLRYKWRRGQSYVYRVKIIGEQGDYGEYLTGDVTYKVLSVTDDEVELAVSKSLTHGETREGIAIVVVPSRGRHGSIRFFTVRENEKDTTITIDPRGQTLHIHRGSQLPYLLGDLSQLMIEPLSKPTGGVWTIDNSGATVIETSYPYSRYTRVRSHEGVPATEKSVYTIQSRTNNLITIAKHYELTTAATVNGKPQFQANGDGKLVFDIERGVPSSLTFNVQVTAREATKTEEIPFRITYRLLDAEELAKIAKEAEEAKKKEENAAKEKARPLTAAEIDAAVADLASGDAKRVGEAAKLFSEKKPAHPSPKAAKALEAVMLNSENQGPVRVSAATALKDWSSQENVPALITAIGDEWPPVRAAAIEALIKYKPRKAMEAIAERLGDGFTRGPAAKALKAFGPAAENAVLPQVESQDPWTAAEAIRILQAIGTKKSIHVLEKAAKSSNWMVNRPAQKAIEAIQLRERIKP